MKDWKRTQHELLARHLRLAGASFWRAARGRGHGHLRGAGCRRTDLNSLISGNVRAVENVVTTGTMGSRAR